MCIRDSYNDMEGERAARNAEGEVYYVPANMTFTQWKKAFVDGVKNGLTVATVGAIMKAKRELEPLKAEMFPEYLTDKKERKNTQALIDYVNGCENADPDVVALYSKMGAMENIRANGIPMKVSHGRGYAVNYRYYTRNDQLAEVELIIPKLAGDDLTGQVVTTLHEEMHLMDLFNRADPAKYCDWFSSSHAKLSSFFQKKKACQDHKYSNQYHGNRFQHSFLSSQSSFDFSSRSFIPTGSGLGFFQMAFLGQKSFPPQFLFDIFECVCHNLTLPCIFYFFDYTTSGQGNTIICPG